MLRTRFTIPTPGSPGCVLAGASVLFGLLGIPLLIMGISALVRVEGSQTDNLVLFGTGLVLTVIAIPCAISGFKKSESPGSLLPLDVNPLERLNDTRDPLEIELVNDEIAEASRIARELVPSDLRLLEVFRTTAATAPSRDDVINTLAAKASTKIQFANPALQPIAFAFMPITAWSYVKGVLLEGLTWALLPRP